MVRLLFPNCSICSSNDYTILTRKSQLLSIEWSHNYCQFYINRDPYIYACESVLWSLSSLSVFLVPSHESCSEFSCYINTLSRKTVSFFGHLDNSIISLIPDTVQMTVSEIDENLNELYVHESGVYLQIILSYVFIVYYVLCFSLMIKRQFLWH